MLTFPRAKLLLSTSALASIAALTIAGPTSVAEAKSAQGSHSNTTMVSGWVPVKRMQTVFSTYGGPSTLGVTADEYVYLYCQMDAGWGWQTFTYVPSLGKLGWIRNHEITGYTNPIDGLEICG